MNSPGSEDGSSLVHPYETTLWILFFFSSRRRHTRYLRDWSSDVCSSDLGSWLGAVFDWFRGMDQPYNLLPSLHIDRKSTRLNSSHANISYAVFCLKKK